MPPMFPKSISDIQYIYIGRPISISDIWDLYPTSGYLYLTSDIYIGRPIYNTRLRLGQGLGLELGQGYRTSDIDI